MQYKYVIGIDEAGRGPLAGPVYVGGVCIKGAVPEIFGAVKDSKKLSPKKREEWFSLIQEYAASDAFSFRSSYVAAVGIDTYGIVRSVHTAIRRIMHSFAPPPEETLVLLDGGLRAPKKYDNQRTIIRGDEKEAIIALASIVAKVMRDKRMIQYAEKYPEYGFEYHKGYGTKLHRKLIAEKGVSPIHRLSFIHF